MTKQPKNPKEIVCVDISTVSSTIDDSIEDYVVEIDSKDKKSFVWQHFGKLMNDTTNKSLDAGFNYCNLCLTNLKMSARDSKSKPVNPLLQIKSIQKYKSFTSTTNLSNHLIDVHKVKKHDLTSEEGSRKLTEYFGVTTTTSVNNPQLEKDYLLPRRLVLLCARALISYNALSSDSVAFTDFLKSYGIVLEKGPHRTTLTRSALNDVYFEMMPLIKALVQNLKYCAISLDLWTDSGMRRGYITFNLSCITETFELLNINLKTGFIPKPHSAEEIAKQYYSILKEFGIENVSIYIVSDKGSNMVKFVGDQNLDNHYCLGHGFHNLVNVDGFAAVTEIDELLAKVKKAIKKLRFRTTELMEEDQNVRNEILTKIDAMDDAISDDLFSESDDEEGFTPAERFPLDLVSLFNDPSDPMSTITKKRYKTIKSYSKTRWHSILIMLESLGSQRAAANRVLSKIKKNPIKISIDEWDLLNHLVGFLRIFRKEIESFSSEKNPTLNNALVFRVEIESALAANTKDHYLIAELKEKMLAKLDERFPITEEILIGASLDPCLQNFARLSEELAKRNTTKFDLIKKEIIKIASNVSVKATPSEVPQAQSQAATSKSKRKEPSQLSKLIQKHAYDKGSCRSKDQKIDEEIHKFFLVVIPEDDVEQFDILQFWKDHGKSLPYMAEVCKKYLCIPLTSTSSERAFSYAGILISAKRRSLGPYVVEKTLFIHDNYDLVKKTLFCKEMFS